MYCCQVVGVVGRAFNSSFSSVSSPLQLVPVGQVNGSLTTGGVPTDQVLVYPGSSTSSYFTGSGIVFSSAAFRHQLLLTNGGAACDQQDCGSYVTTSVQLYNASGPIPALCGPVDGVQLSFCATTGALNGLQTYDTYRTSMSGVFNTTATTFDATDTYSYYTVSTSLLSNTHCCLPSPLPTDGPPPRPSFSSYLPSFHTVPALLDGPLPSIRLRLTRVAFFLLRTWPSPSACVWLLCACLCMAVCVCLCVCACAVRAVLLSGGGCCGQSVQLQLLVCVEPATAGTGGTSQRQLDHWWRSH